MKLQPAARPLCCCRHRQARCPQCCSVYLCVTGRSAFPPRSCKEQLRREIKGSAENNSCFYLCNGCRMTVHILAGWSCHKSLILCVSMGLHCQVVFFVCVFLRWGRGGVLVWWQTSSSHTFALFTGRDNAIHHTSLSAQNETRFLSCRPVASSDSTGEPTPNWLANMCVICCCFFVVVVCMCFFFFFS